MRRLVLVVASVLLSLELSAQVGVITVEDKLDMVPLSQWYVIRNKSYNNHQFFYSEEKTSRYVLKTILEQEGYDIDIPEGVDSEGDLYWNINWGNEFGSTIYLNTSKGFSLITIFTQ